MTDPFTARRSRIFKPGNPPDCGRCCHRRIVKITRSTRVRAIDNIDPGLTACYDILIPVTIDIRAMNPDYPVG